MTDLQAAVWGAPGTPLALCRADPDRQGPIGLQSKGGWLGPLVCQMQRALCQGLMQHHAHVQTAAESDLQGSSSRMGWDLLDAVLIPWVTAVSSHSLLLIQHPVHLQQSSIQECGLQLQLLCVLQQEHCTLQALGSTLAVLHQPRHRIQLTMSCPAACISGAPPAWVAGLCKAPSGTHCRLP